MNTMFMEKEVSLMVDGMLGGWWWKTLKGKDFKKMTSKSVVNLEPIIG